VHHGVVAPRCPASESPRTPVQCAHGECRVDSQTWLGRCLKAADELRVRLQGEGDDGEAAKGTVGPVVVERQGVFNVGKGLPGTFLVRVSRPQHQEVCGSTGDSSRRVVADDTVYQPLLVSVDQYRGRPAWVLGHRQEQDPGDRSSGDTKCNTGLRQQTKATSREARMGDCLLVSRIKVLLVTVVSSLDSQGNQGTCKGLAKD